MTVKEFITSGVIETYVLGMATAQEKQEVERMAAENPEVQAEIEAISNALSEYAQMHEMAPPAGLEEKIWKTIQASEIEKTAEPKIVAINQLPKDTFFKPWMAAASILIIVGLGSLNIVFFNKWKSAEKQVIALNNEKLQLVQENQIQRTSLEETKEELAFLSANGTKAIPMKGLPRHPDIAATVFWNSLTQQVYLTTGNLPIPEEGKQFQLWAIVEGKPVDAGVFDISKGKTRLQKMKNFAAAQAFAVTLEKQGGSTTPTLEAMVVLGNI